MSFDFDPSKMFQQEKSFGESVSKTPQPYSNIFTGKDFLTMWKKD